MLSLNVSAAEKVWWKSNVPTTAEIDPLMMLPINHFASKNSDGTLRLKHDHSYYYQCQMQIFATKREFCDFVVWSSNELHVERLTSDEDPMVSSIPIAEKFWKLMGYHVSDKLGSQLSHVHICIQ